MYFITEVLQLAIMLVTSCLSFFKNIFNFATIRHFKCLFRRTFNACGSALQLL